MSAWAERARSLSVEHGTWADQMSREESSKVGRLHTLAKQIGLPIYDTRDFDLPRQIGRYRTRCARITSRGFWSLAVRFSRGPNSTAFFRKLGVSSAVAVQAARRHARRGPFTATVTPYRTPDRSGTLFVGEDRALLELAFGPHTWISKGGPNSNRVVRCLLQFPRHSVEYSSSDQETRTILYRVFEDVVGIVLGCRLRALADFEARAYAEFHWHIEHGYRFIECSFADAWTGRPAAAMDQRGARNAAGWAAHWEDAPLRPLEGVKESLVPHP
jgi:hypothetical protein